MLERKRYWLVNFMVKNQFYKRIRMELNPKYISERQCGFECMDRCFLVLLQKKNGCHFP